ncbi:OprO/OprP family phosphate-selective porin [Flavobacterium chuncheonense]|uniref:OprO/OprP family phosphate-selective porin n=1 Tax=Flavobacterium chuncheonense TaxID=2026653 RepID=A0ABW5YNU8_9FLAO
MNLKKGFHWNIIKQFPTLFFLLTTAIVFSQQTQDTTKLLNVRYGSKGFEFQTKDNKFLLQIQSRFQFRVAAPYDQDPVTYDDIDLKNQQAFKVNRARLKVGGHAFEPWLKYYWEYELSQSNLLDFRLMIEKWKWLSLKVGQWKVEYSRERFISSGQQQMVERSLINRPFTVDRQQGIELYGHLDGKGPADFNYWFAALTGTGRGNRENDDRNLMYFGRLQWNFIGDVLDFTGGDLEFHEKPSANIAMAAITNRSPYTRFSQSGGGNLEGFEIDNAGQYRINQFNVETTFMYKGFSWQSEWHHKYVIDRLNADTKTNMRGYYVQAGYFFHEIADWFPKNLEVAGRHSEYRPNTDIQQELQMESSLAFNWFFNGHKNKLTSEVTYFDFHEASLPYNHGWRFRLQWDISL